jgi:hypothetical protein
VNAWREQQFEKAMTDKLKSLRETAKISYQPGFEPPAEAKGKAGGKAAAASPIVPAKP